MSDYNGLISVYIITHNRIELLKRCLDSVLNQSYKKLEVIVVNDYSTDGTASFLQAMSNKDNRVRFINNQENRGACFSRNAAIDLATGEYITGVDDDDYFLNDRISNFIEARNLLNSNVLLYTDSIWKTNKGFNKPIINRFFIKKVTNRDLLYFNFIGNQVFAKSQTLKDNKFDVNFPAWQDFDCWYNILKVTGGTAEKVKKFSYIQDVSHEHERISSSKIDKINQVFEIFSIKNKLSSTERLLLKNHFYSYGLRNINIVPLFLCLIFGGVNGFLISARNFKFLLKRWFS